MKLKILGLLMAGTIAAGAQATVSYQVSQDFGPTTTDFSTDTYTLAGFNSSLGTLVGVSIDYSYTANMSGTLTNNAASAQRYYIGEDNVANFTFSGSVVDSETNVVSYSQSYGKAANGSNTGTPLLNAGQSVTFGPAAPLTDLETLSFGSGDDLSRFINALSFSVATSTGFTIQGGGGNVANDISTLGLGNVTITYTYDAAPPSVPEAATWAMMLVGFGAMGATMRRRSTAVTFG